MDEDVGVVPTARSAIIPRTAGNAEGSEHMAKGIAHRDWIISRADYRDDNGAIDEAAFRNAVQMEMSLAEHIGERLGVAIVCAPVRRRYPGGGFYTEAWMFETATVPSVRDGEETPDLSALEPALVEDADPLATVE